jgi:hypothetical protein
VRLSSAPIRLVVAATLLLLVTACDWRGFEHERKVKAEHAGAVQSQAAEAQDAFDKLCVKDPSACWQELVQVSHRTTLGPAATMTGVSQVCCEVPKTDVTQDHSTPSGFVVTMGTGTIFFGAVQAGVALAPVANDGTVRGLPGHVRHTSSLDSYRWVEGGVTYIVSARKVPLPDVETFLSQLTLHRPR